MTQYFAESGEVVPITVVKASAMTVSKVKTKDGKDGYNAVQVNTGSKRAEFRLNDVKDFQAGQKIDLSKWQIGELVNVEGTSKGRGFAGAMKRHGFKGFPASHGHDRPRSVGSIGQRFPQHTRKGLRMAGHMGNIGVTVKNLQVVEVNPAKNLLALKGAIPGHRNGWIRIISTGRVKPIVKLEIIKEEKKKK